jgi:hypothetical protein
MSTLVAVLSQIIPVHAVPFLLFKVHFNITLPATLGLASGLFPLGFSTKRFTHIFAHIVPHSTEKNEMGGACGAYGGRESGSQGVGGET